MAAASVQQANPAVKSNPRVTQAAGQAAAYDINYALADWRRLRAIYRYTFAD